MRTIGSLVLLAMAAGALGVSADTPDPARQAAPPPSPRMPAHGTVLFLDDFRSPKLEGWTVDRPGVWRVQNGVLRGELPDEKQEHSIISAGDSSWRDYVLELDVCGMRGVDKGAVVRVQDKRGLGVDLRGPGYQDVRVHVNETLLGKADIENGNGVWHHLRIEVRGERGRVTIDGKTVLDKKLPTRVPRAGGIALPAYTGGVGQCTVYYDNVLVVPLTTATEAAR